MYNLPQISSSHDLNSAELFLHQNPEMLSSNYLPSNAQVLIHEYNQEFIGEPSQIIPGKSQTVRKDRHSKIFTSKGPRDRRVRLSISIARKFFDLQEMLGFDKPSKTLDWLLTKSKAAIKDLIVQKKPPKGLVSSSHSECEVISAGNLENGSDSRRKPVFLSAKELRVKARARARERTREKMFSKQMNEAIATRKKNGYDLLMMNNSIPNIHNYMNNQYLLDQFHKVSSSNYGDAQQSILDCPINYAAASHEDLIQESIMIRRKFKQCPPSSILGFPTNFVVSRDSSSNVTQNSWDVSSFTTQSDISAIMDQHKFINRT